MDARETMSVGQVAERSGFAASALRYYEEQGLLAAARSPGGRRQYPRSILRRLAFIRAASSIGLSLEEIRAELDQLPNGRTPTARDWQHISRHWRGRLDEQIRALEQLRDGLDSCIGCGCLSLRRCRISNPGDIQGAHGPGARHLAPVLRRHPGAGPRAGGPGPSVGSRG